MREFLDRSPRAGRGVRANDLMAAGALRALRDRSSVPADVSVVGFDDSPLALSTDPPLRRCTSRPSRWGGRWRPDADDHVPGRRAAAGPDPPDAPRRSR